MNKLLKHLAFLTLFLPALCFAQTPNMGITKPTPGVTAGPQWAQMLNDAIDKIDAHDHSSGKGAKVGPSGLNINADLNFGGNNATTIRSARLSSQGGALTGGGEAGEIYNVGGNLYWTNGSGAAVQITSGSSVVSSITNAFSTSTPGAFPYTVSAGDAQKVLLIDTSATRTINLPAATTNVMFLVKDSTGSAATNNITIVRNGANTIDGAGSNKTLAENSGLWFLISDGVSNWTTGFMPGSTLSIISGGTGATTASGARTNLGLGTIATQNASSVSITGGSITGITDLAVADGGTGASTASAARTNLGLGTIATQDASNVSITGGSVTGITDLAVADGGTGASSASTARSNLGAAASGANSDISSISNMSSITMAAGTIFTNTSDGSDNSFIQIGHANTGRGAYAFWTGNEYGGAGGPGSIQLSTGNVSGAGIDLSTQSVSGRVCLDTNSVQRFCVTGGGDLDPQADDSYALCSSAHTCSNLWLKNRTLSPTLTASGGTTTSSTTYWKYFRMGKLVFFYTNFSVTPSGASGFLEATLPAASASLGDSQGGACYGPTGTLAIGWTIGSGASVMDFVKIPASTFSSGVSQKIECVGMYEEA